MSVSVVGEQFLWFFVLWNHDSLIQNVDVGNRESVLQLSDVFKYMIMVTKTMFATPCLHSVQYTNSTIYILPGPFSAFFD